MKQEELILARIRVENGMAMVCADERLSAGVRERMLDQTWPLPLQSHDMEEVHQTGLNAAFSGKMLPEPAETFDTPAYQLPPRLGCDMDIQELAKNKDIMELIPKKTSFPHIKRLLNRVLRLTNRYQQIFNNAVYRILVVLAGTLEWVKDGLAMTDDKANRALKKIDLQSEELRRFRDVLNEQTNTVLQQQNVLEQKMKGLPDGNYLKSKVDELEGRCRELSEECVRLTETLSWVKSRDDYWTSMNHLREERQQMQAEQLAWYKEILKQQQERMDALNNQSRVCAETLESQNIQIVQNREKLESIQNQAQFCTETLESQNIQIVQNREKLESIQNQAQFCMETLESQNFQIVQNREKLESIQNQAQYNSEQIEAHSYRLKAAEKKTEKLQYGITAAEKAGKVLDGAFITSYSQSGEDTIVDYILESFEIEPSQVRYLDLGANHAKYLSNTYYFYLRKARGVLVEANPELIPELKATRKEDVVLNCCVAHTSGEKRRFFIANKDGLSSAEKDSLEDAAKQNSEVYLKSDIEVDSVTFNELCKTYFSGSPTFVSMDLEGIEMDILKSIDFETYRPLIYIIETVPYRTGLVIENKETEIVDFMRSKGYVEYAFTGINSIFVDKKHCGEELQ